MQKPKRPYNAKKTSVQQGPCHAEDPLGNLCAWLYYPYVLYEYRVRIVVYNLDKKMETKSIPHTHIHIHGKMEK